MCLLYMAHVLYIILLRNTTTHIYYVVSQVNVFRLMYLDYFPMINNACLKFKIMDINLIMPLLK